LFVFVLLSASFVVFLIIFISRPLRSSRKAIHPLRLSGLNRSRWSLFSGGKLFLQARDFYWLRLCRAKLYLVIYLLFSTKNTSDTYIWNSSGVKGKIPKSVITKQIYWLFSIA